MNLEQAIASSGRSWWQAMLLGGRVISEWETMHAPANEETPLNVNPSRLSQWEMLPKDQLVAARLICPTGQVAEVAAARPYSIFQFKAAVRGPGVDSVQAHVLGVLLDDQELGDCQCWAYQIGGLIRFKENIFNFKKYGVGSLNLDANDLRL